MLKLKTDKSTSNLHKKKWTRRGRYSFVKEKHIEDIKQDEKVAPDLLESIMRPTDPVKEAAKTMKMNQF